ncbi:hypothetical protein [Mesorhizobium sp. J8]|uniref:hypothetical protein n=1 Tax=Mesorhizobium sp. J8 TaxID=2777475 RepID=UPI001CD905EB|nr:hypothetical protein [Mesorhizobium sp. J8]
MLASQFPGCVRISIEPAKGRFADLRLPRLARSPSPYSGWRRPAIVRSTLSGRKTVDLAKIGSLEFSEGHGLSPLPHFDDSGRIFPLCRQCLENSFYNGLVPRGSCIVIGGADLLERPHETVCPK